MITEMTLIQGAVSKVFGDFVSKVVSDGVDVLKSAIKDADLDRKSYNQNLQTRLYQLMIDALNRFTHDTYRKQDKLYDAAESILKGYVSTKDNTDAVKSGLKMLVSDVNNDTCREFLETLCGEICRDDNSDLYKEMDILWKKRESEYVHGEFEKNNQYGEEILRKLTNLKDVIDYIKEMIDGKEDNQTESNNKVPVVNRAEEYAQKWDKNVFLNNFNKRDKNAGVNIKLKDIYIEKHLPHYVWKADNEPLDDLKDLLSEYIVDNDDRKMLLILGQPGIGKSTLITWIMANLVEKKDNIYVYQLASDLKKINWLGDDILCEILKTLKLKYDELENKTLILDGFDEVYVKGDRERILYKMNQELEKKNYLKEFSLIITCRENYVNKVELDGIEYITLQAWDEEQIKSFCKKYEEKNIRKSLTTGVNIISENIINKILKKSDIFGIPLILYMVLALNVDIERSSSTVDIYDQIFSLKKGGIYDRCYDVEHRINSPEIKKHIHQISQRIAFWIFENKADEAFISQKKFEEICENEMRQSGEKSEEIQRDALIGNFFKLKHCEGKGTDELQFVHRSIYEYFVAVYFFESLNNLKTKEEVAGKLGELLKYGRLSEQILEFIKYKFDNMKEYKLSDITREIFTIMLRDGMTYYVEGKYMNIIVREMNIFSNMLNIVHLWNPKLGKLDDIVFYLQYNHRNTLNLIGANLSEANLSGADLIRADLSEANLSGADLIRADLSGAHLFRADLSGADLIRADLSGAHLGGANLSGANLSGADLSEANLSVANLSEANLIGANLIEANLSGADLIRADLSGADLSKANLSGADLIRANLIGANLIGANLIVAALIRVNLSEADLSGANLIGANLSEANLSGANLSGADLSEADLSEANLSGADLSEANLSEADLIRTIFDENQVNLLSKGYDLTNSRVYISKTEEIISYDEYCKGKQRT